MKVKCSTCLLVLVVLFVAANYGRACPTAVLEANRQYVIVGRNVILDGSDSNDFDGPITKYEWDFTDNSSYDYTETSSSYPDGAFDGKTTYAYNDANTYTVRLRVTDNTSNTDTDTYDVNVTSDSDGDDLPAGWENLYGLSDSNFADGDEDSDSDGYNNLCEYLHDSNANDGNKVPDANYPITIYVPADVNSIQRAINASIDGDTIMVSQGTYYEAIDFGGVPCTVTSTDPNDPFVVAATIIDGNGAYHVVTFDSNEDANSILKGFTITGGDANDFSELNYCGGGIYCSGTSTSPTISKCIIRGNSAFSDGGGMYCYNYASPTITNCYFWDNETEDQDGGGLCNDHNASPTLISCVFVQNYAENHGGGISNEVNSCPTLVNCTFSKNSGWEGGAMWNYSDSDPNVINCIFWGNDACSTGDEIKNNSASDDPNFRYCDIRGCGGSGDWDADVLDPNCDDGGNLDADPGFVDPNDPCGPDGVFGTHDDGLRLGFTSYGPCIDSADGNAAPSADITGQTRIDVPYLYNVGTPNEANYVDIGAYESRTVWFVDDNASGDNDGGSWDNAFTDLQDALAAANSVDKDEIWVAEGTYEPNGASDRSASFQLVQYVAVYGGFDGTETGRYQRNWKSHETTLSGDIGTLNDANDNSYHVVKGADDAILDGFTITGGNANGSASNSRGGGIYCGETSPTVSNCIIAGNNASIYGGGMLNFYECSPTVTDCLFKDNSSGRGGGMANLGSGSYDCFTKVSNCAFVGNEAWQAGGGMSNVRALPTVINCTFTGNKATVDGGGMFNLGGSDATVTNCIFWGDSSTEIYDSSSSPTVTYCNVEGGYTGTGNDSNDPRLADGNNPLGYDGYFGTYDDGLRLSPNSHCIDSADGNSAPSADVVGLDRVDISTVDNNGVGEPNYADRGSYESYHHYGSDTDGDGLWDYEEELLGTSPDSNDEDDDGVLDGDEFNLHHTNPFSEDTDGDGLSDSDEINIHNTNPLSTDTDGDDMPDGWEVYWDLKPLDSNDASEDPDGDGRDNLQEYNTGTDPFFFNAITVAVYQYDNAGQVTKETIEDEDGYDAAVTQYKYDELGRRWQHRRWADAGSSDDVNDMITLYSYYTGSEVNETVRKAEVNNPDVNAIDSNDLVTQNTYDSLGRLTNVKDAEGGNTNYTYYEGGDVNEITDPNGNTTTHYYDYAGRLQSIVDEEGHYRLNTYDSLGRTIEQIACDSSDNELMQTRFEYDGAGHVTRRAVMADASSSSEINTSVDMVIDYNYPAEANGLMTDQRIYYTGGTAVTSYEYDDLGRRTETIDPAGNKTVLTYDAMSRIEKHQQIDDNPLAGEPNLVITTEYEYDSQGRVYKQIAEPCDANFTQETLYYHDVLGNRITETKPDGVYTTYEYDALGRLKEKIADANTGGIQQKTEYSYDRLGRQVSITGYADPGTAQATNYTYDALDRITNVAYPDGNDIDFGYNAAGRVIRRNDQRGIVTTYSYDGVYNMTKKLVDGNTVTNDANETFTYDGLGRMLAAIKEVNEVNFVAVSESAFVYNGIGTVTEANEALFGDASPAEIRYTYDQAGYPNSVTYPDTNSIEITPDWQGRIELVKADSNVASYKYVGSRVAERYYSVPNVTYRPEYDNLGRMTRSYAYKVSTGNPVIMDLAYSYDGSNNRSQADFDHIPDCNAGPAEYYDYDDLNRITDANYFVVTDPNLADYETEVFTMDKLGNRTQVNLRDTNDVNYVVDNLTNRYDSVGANSLTYDEAGNLEVDKDGYKYHHDYENRIIKITKDPNDTAVAEFAYDALGRRIRKIDSIASETTLYYHNNNWQVLAETDANETTQRWFVYGNYIDEPLMMVAPCLDNTDPSGYFAHTVYYIQDGTYNVRALVSTRLFVSEQTAYDVYGQPLTWRAGDADADGDIDPNDEALFSASWRQSECDPNYNWRCDVDNSGTVNIWDMMAFANIRFSSTPANQQSYFTNPYYFTGRRLDILDDGALTVQYNRNRYYDYYTGRWLTHDPLGINPAGGEHNAFWPFGQYTDGLSLYQYVGSGPVTNLDLYGLKVCCKIRKTTTSMICLLPPFLCFPVTTTTCTQEEIPNPHGCLPHLACCDYYKDRNNVTFYGAYEHPEGCCWCTVYRQLDKPGLFPGAWHLGWAHQRVAVECEQGRGNYYLDVWPKAPENFWAYRWHVVPIKSGALPATGEGMRIGRTSCDSGDAAYSAFSTGTWWYIFPFRDCRAFAMAAAKAIAGTCP